MGFSKDPKKVFPLPPPLEYKVGYGNPPLETQFKPGQSGNPGGRPRGSKNRPSDRVILGERLKGIVLVEAYRGVRVTDRKRAVTVPLIQAIVRSLAHSAAKGNLRAQQLFTELVGMVERDNSRSYGEWVQEAIRYKMEWQIELERRSAQGIVAPDPPLHPDHIIVHNATGEIRLVGPMTEQAKSEWDRLCERKEAAEAEIDQLRALFARRTFERYRAVIVREIEHYGRISDMVSNAIPREYLDWRQGTLDMSPVRRASPKPKKPKAKAGRQGGYSAAVATEIGFLLRQGLPLRVICDQSGKPGISTTLRWLTEHKEFAELYARSRDAEADLFRDQCLKVTEEARNKTARMDHQHIQSLQAAVQTRKWMIGKLRPNQRGDQHLGGAPVAPTIILTGRPDFDFDYEKLPSDINSSEGSHRRQS